MSTSAKVIAMPEPSGYGAIELKKFINKHTIRGFVITISIMVLLFLFNFAFGIIKGAVDKAPTLAPVVKLTLQQLPPGEETVESAPPPTEMVMNTGPAARAGTPVPVPEALIKEDLKDFATTEELSRASSVGGDGVDLGGFSQNIDWEGQRVQVEHREEEPAPDEFIPVEKEPSLDYDKLKRSVQYPDIARRAGVEGKVIVRVLVDKSGKVKKTMIEYTDSELLNESAVKAIRDYGTFTPAIQNGQPITCWVSIPITFQLR